MASVTLRWAAAVAIFLSQAVQAGEDAHDKLVYSRYAKKLQPTAYKLDENKKQSQLDRPATKKDVEAGKAIFSFEGLGEARVWKLPGDEFSESFPVTGEWPVLTTPDSVGNGEICQAEDLRVDGKWKRYFGFVYEGGAAVVPAEEIELLLFYAPWLPREEFFADMSWGITVPGPKPGFWKRQADESPKVGDPLPVELYVRNTRNTAIELPATWYKTAKHGGPALLDACKISLHWAPFDPTYPVQREFVDQEPIRETRFSPDGKKLTVKPGKSSKLLALDLRDWFKVEREGYYEVTLELDWKALRLHDKASNSLTCARRFTVGGEPKLPTIAEFNKTVPVLGGPANEKRLRRVIRETIAPKQAARKQLPAEVAGLLAWSAPVNGLAARIESVSGSWGCGISVLVRLKNVSQRPIAVPTGNPLNEKSPQPFEIHVQQGDGPWQLAKRGWDRYCEQSATDEDPQRAYITAGIEGRETDRPSVTLQPGEHCLAFVCGCDTEDNAQAKRFKVIFQQPKAVQSDHWSGVLETPPHSGQLTETQSAALAGALPMPEHFPAFTYADTGINGVGQDPAIEALWYSNLELVEVLKLYDQAAVRKEFEARMRAEKRLPLKLLMAVVAARAGSEEAALVLLETMKDTDYRTTVNVHGALERLFPFPCTEPPAWVVELSMAALSDNRFATGLEKTNWADGTSFTIASCQADDLEWALCYSKCTKALPLLIERLKKGISGSYTAVMLGEMGDERAIPFLMEMVETAGKTEKDSKEHGLSEEFTRPACALGRLKAREAVPLLLRYIEFPKIISDLGEIGDLRVVPVLQGLVSAKGKIIRDGKDVCPDLAQERLFTAKVVLAGFDKNNGVARLGEMLGDQSLSVHQRYDVVIYLGRRQDPRSIPYLLKAIKTESRYRPDKTTESRHYLMDMAICDLGAFKCKAAVEGLIECFDVDFKAEELGKGERATPATYRNRIARSLQAITGQSFGANKKQWQGWWREKGKQGTELK